EVLAAVIKAGATTLNIPDTVGYTLPDEFGGLIAGIIAHTPGAKDVIISVHCHDDLGLAVANSLAGLRAGARQAEVTINGIGERAGNASLEELVMVLRTRGEKIGLHTGIDTKQLCRASKLISRSTSYPVPPNKAIVGANAFAHESGIHQDGMIKNAQTYEIMRPEDVGAVQTTLVLGKHSGRNAVSKRLTELGYALEGEALARAFAEFKKLADRKKAVHDADLVTLASDERTPVPELWSLLDLQVACGTTGLPTATVRLRGPDGTVHVQAAVGTGPVDATYKAIDELVKVPVSLLEFAVNAVTEGIDALGEVSVRVRHDDQRSCHGHGADTDIIVASAKAYLTAMNHVLSRQSTAHVHAQKSSVLPAASVS
ncbi:MAG: 2-isopropylmalate synthase, partial [Candidatus Didemnitutus sp.]|nr:2-isopropylmalate synthase [Candidatus Didemnitutus sp.]